MRPRGVIVAIDGPAGAGKSTLSRRLAERVGYTLVDTGALYRAVALSARRRGVAHDDGPALGALASSLRFAYVDGQLEVDGERYGDALRTSETSAGASRVSAHAEVRSALLGVQREMGRAGGVVLEGRDIGTVVYPDAELKVFLVASDEERARRRLAELVERGEGPLPTVGAARHHLQVRPQVDRCVLQQRRVQQQHADRLTRDGVGGVEGRRHRVGRDRVLVEDQQTPGALVERPRELPSELVDHGVPPQEIVGRHHEVDVVELDVHPLRAREVAAA